METVLIIDDINDNIIALKALVKEAFPDFGILSALDGASGIALAKQNIPDIILLDVFMPEMDGFDVCKVLKEDDVLMDIPVVFVTAVKESKENRIKALQVGADGFLSKPIDETELKAQIKAMLKISAANKAKRTNQEQLEVLVFEKTKALEKELEDRKITEKQLSECDSKLQRITNNIIDVVWITDLDFNIQYISPSIKKLIGIASADYVKKSIEERYPPATIHKFKTLLQSEIKKENLLPVIEDRSLLVEGEQYTKDGDIITVSMNISFLRNENNTIIGLQGTTRDITAQKKIENEIIESQRRLSTLLGNLPGVAYRCAYDNNWTMEYISDGCFDLTGYKAEDFINNQKLPFNQIIVEKYRQHLNLLWSAVLPQKRVFTAEYQIKTKEGKTKWVWEQGCGIYDENGNVEALEGFITDITDQKIATAELKRASDLWNTTFDAIADGVFILDAQQVILKCNSSILKLLKKTEAEIVGKKCYDVIHKKNCPRTDCPFLKLENTLQREKMNLTLGDRFFEIILDPIIDENNRCTGAVHIIRDVTEQKIHNQTQEILLKIAKTRTREISFHELLQMVRSDLSSIMDTTNFLVALYNKEKDILKKIVFEDTNDHFDQWPCSETISGMVVKQGKTILLNGSELQQFINKHKLKNMGTPAKSWIGVPLLIESQAVGVIVLQNYNHEHVFDSKKNILKIIAREIALFIEKKQMIDDLVLSKLKAEESDRLKTAFLANMSHEIRTPLNGILGFMGLLSNPYLSSERHEKYVDIMKKSSNRLITTVDDIIEMSKIEAGVVTLNQNSFDLVALVEELVDFYKPEAIEKGVDLNFQKNLTHSKLVLFSDLNKITSILTNLIKNGVKYTEKGSVNVELTCYSKNYTVIVRDTGIGVPKNRQEAIFNRFEQADISDHRAFQGSGLGLAITKTYVEFLGGTIRLESEESKGSTFIVEMPINLTNGDNN